MTERCRKILEVLLKSEIYLSLQQISEILHVSKRSIYYDICRINEWLEDNDILNWKQSGEKVFILSGKLKIKLRHALMKIITMKTIFYPLQSEFILSYAV